MEICPHCKQQFKDSRALRIHITVVHIAYKIADIEKQLATMENSIVAIIKLTSKHELGLAQEIQAEAKASLKRDKGLLDRLKRISRNSTKHDHDILEIIDGLRAYNQSAKAVNTEQVTNEVLKVRAQK